MSGRGIQIRLTGAAAAVYTASVRTQIVAADIAEKTATGDTLTVYIVASGDTTASANTLEFTQGVVADAAAQVGTLLSHYLNPGDSVWAFTGTADHVVMRLSVVEGN